MGLFLKVSNSIQSLSKELAKDALINQGDVFNTLYIATQTKGMNNWLKLELAAEMGIMANYKFIKPNDVISQIYYLFGGERKQMLNSENLKWLLYSCLNNSDFKTNFPTVAEYYQLNDEKRIGLAAKLADLFDQYQLYRPEYTFLWELDSLVNDDEFEEKWQAALWKIAFEKLNNEFLFRSTIEAFIYDALQSDKNQIVLKEKFSQIYLFGLSIITPSHLSFYKTLSTYIDVTFYILDPAYKNQWFPNDLELYIKDNFPTISRKHTADDHNVLLSNLGMLIQHTFQLFLNKDSGVNYLQIEGRDFNKTTLLQKIQDDISCNAPKVKRHTITKADLTDGTITINACYTAVREVEVFYNYLAQIVEKSPSSFSVKSMVVMVSDINLYAPYIKAVFNNAPYHFPYTIADQSIEDVNPIITALKDIFNLSKDNFTSENVIQLLDNSLIKARFGIYNTNLIRTALDKASVRFGIEGSNANDTQYISFKNGIKRLLYGYCMVGSEAYLDGTDDYFPVELAEGHEAKDIISFCHFVNVLESCINERDGLKSLSDWVSYTVDVIQHFILEDSEKENEDYKAILFQFRKLNESALLMDEEISFTVFSRQLLRNLNNETTSGSYLNGGITFCSFIPMRSIPFDYVAMLGLNSDLFPRKDSAIQFDLIAKHPKLGDRNIKENDKHLFLETILSANKQLYLSYIGRNSSDNKVLLPSSLVEELVDYIAEGLAKKMDLHSEFITLHPLHGFSHKYNSSNHQLYSYLGDVNFKLPKQKPNSSDSEVSKEININDLINFFKNPFKYYYNKRLLIYYEEKATVLPETEVFDVDFILKWQVQHDLIKLESHELDTYRTRLLKSGILPLKNASIVNIETIYNGIQNTKVLYDDLRDGETSRFENIKIKCGTDYHIIGKFDGLHNTDFIEIFFSKSDYGYKYVLTAFIKHLIGTCSGITKNSYLISKDKGQVFTFKPLLADDAMAMLQFLIECYVAGQNDIFPYYIDFKVKPKDLIDFDEMQLVGMIEGNISDFSNPLTDPYVLKEFYDGYFEADNHASDLIKNYKTIHQMVAESIINYTF